MRVTKRGRKGLEQDAWIARRIGLNPDDEASKWLKKVENKIKWARKAGRKKKRK